MHKTSPLFYFVSLALLCGCPALSPAHAQGKSDEAPAASATAPPSGVDLVNELATAGRKREALAEASHMIESGQASAALRAQRGFLRREVDDLAGAVEDFTAALAGEGLSAEQRHNVEAGLAEARNAQSQVRLGRGQDALTKGDFSAAAAGAQTVLGAEPDSIPAMHLRLEALVAAKQKAEALAEADQFLQRAPADAALHAQRGFLRRELDDPQGAADDFSAALAGNDLTGDQRHNVETALVEAQTAVRQAVDVEKRDRVATRPAPPRPRAAPADADALIAQGHAPGWAYAQRGLARRKSGELKGAIDDFDKALKRGDLGAKAVADIRYARAEAAAALAERDGKPQMAEASYRELLKSEPQQADAWYKLGYLLMKEKHRGQGAEALTKGLEIHPVATAYLDAANASILSNAPLASRQYRQGLDRWYAGDSSVDGRSAADLERIKNEIVQADASIQTSAGFGTVTGRPLDAGGTNNSGGAETRLRFDGRYLPAVQGLEAFARGLTGKDANGERETEAGAGLRYRPIPDLNFYFGGMADHFFEPHSVTEFVATWGLGLGADAYPYAVGFKPYWDFGTFGSWRTDDRRVLEDVHGNAGFLYGLRAPIRAAVGPTLLAVAGYDSKATTLWAAGLGPSLLAYVWLGGDKYRSYDAVVTLQVGYIFAVGADERQRGWRAQVGVTF